MPQSKWLVSHIPFWAMFYIVTSAFSDEVRIELGGPRKVKADVSVVGDAYIIKVRFLPLHSFDAATNRDLNRKKGRIYGLQALARHLSKQGTTRLSVSGAEILRDGNEGKSFAMTIRIPQKGVSVITGQTQTNTDSKPSDNKPNGSVAFDASLFHAKQEYTNTIQELDDLFWDRLQELEKQSHLAESFPKAVNMLRDDELIRLDCVAKEVEKDRLLSDIDGFDEPSERRSLLKLIDKQKEAVRDHSLAAIEIYTQEKRGEPKVPSVQSK